MPFDLKLAPNNIPFVVNWQSYPVSGQLLSSIDNINSPCPAQFINFPDYIYTSGEDLNSQARIQFKFNIPQPANGETVWGLTLVTCGSIYYTRAVGGPNFHNPPTDLSDPIPAALEVRNPASGQWQELRHISIGWPPIEVFSTALAFQGVYSFYNPDITPNDYPPNTNPSVFHERLLSFGIDPLSLDWSNDIRIRFADRLLHDTNQQLGLNYVYLLVWYGPYSPIQTLGGIKVGGIGIDSKIPGIKVQGGVLGNGTSLVSGPIVETPEGGSLILPKSNFTGTETRQTFGGVKLKGRASESFDKNFPGLISDFNYFYSGGLTNSDPNQSLGGEISSSQAASNLFDDFKPEETLTGSEEYRCIYVVNALSSPLRNVNLWLSAFPASSSLVLAGIEEADDTQFVNISERVGVGTLTLGIGSQSFTVSADPDLTQFGQNFQDSIIANTSFEEVIVEDNAIGTTIQFKVTFTGIDGKRRQEALTLINNNLSGSPIVSIDRGIIGSPIDSVAESISNEKEPPISPTFVPTTKSSPIVIPILNGYEGFPLWFKRIIEESPQATENDGFTLNIDSSPNSG